MYLLKTSGSIQYRQIPLDHRILRYADVLLMYAEACNELGEDGTARTYLNEVRNRVKLPAVTSSGNELRKAIRLERRLELAWEQTESMISAVGQMTMARNDL